MKKVDAALKSEEAQRPLIDQSVKELLTWINSKDGIHSAPQLSYLLAFTGAVVAREHAPNYEEGRKILSTAIDSAYFQSQEQWDDLYDKALKEINEDNSPTL